MQYNNIKKAKFLSRPNRFLAHIEIEGKKELCHVKNTGRCKELLTPHATVYVQEIHGEGRKTKYDLISVYKGGRLVNIDSQVVNQVFHEWILGSGLIPNIEFIKPEHRYKGSRFDFYIETVTDKILVEVKGVTLEEKGVALFPDAPTARGVKHLAHLISSLDEGYRAYVVFIIQMKGVFYFAPNTKTHQAFADTLKTAHDLGVQIIALDCQVTKNSITAGDFIEVRLDGLQNPKT